ncbi:hypothetical protein [Burkholderia stagnalis]|uniref:hypothetical protein n=1 Tax=Burkholderia stagnalis TaxID=1503054 RepID=UPI0012D99D51|nr:hypothetical protein [Burkholderia stagnalis]
MARRPESGGEDGDEPDQIDVELVRADQLRYKDLWYGEVPGYGAVFRWRGKAVSRSAVIKKYRVKIQLIISVCHSLAGHSL